MIIPTEFLYVIPCACDAVPNSVKSTILMESVLFNPKFGLLVQAADKSGLYLKSDLKSVGNYWGHNFNFKVEQ